MARETTFRDATVIFDLDGTLIDTAPDLVDTLRHVTVARGWPEPDRDMVRARIAFGAIGMIRAHAAAAGLSPTDEEIRSLHTDFLAHYEARIARLSRPFPGAIEAVDRLLAAGARIAICTNKLSGLADRLMDELALTDRFVRIAGRDSYGAAKPDPAFLGGLMADIGARPRATIFVGDSSVDVKAARAVAIPVVGVSFGYCDVPVTELAPDRLIDHYDEFVEAATDLLGAPVD